MLDPEQYVGVPRGPYCRRCRERVVSLDESGVCYDGCDCEGREDDSPRRQEAIRQLHRDTARMLRRQGFAERAAIHEFFAGRV